MDASTMTAIANMVTQATSTIGAAATQQTKGEVESRAASYKAAGVTFQSETAATIGEYRADLTDWAATTNRNFALARADQIETTAEAQAAQVRANAEAQADIINRSTARTMGRATAAYGAAGVTGGSSLWVLNDIATEGELQSNLAIYGGKVSADWTIYGARVQAANLRQQSEIDTTTAQSQATIYRTMAEAERRAGQIGAAALYAGGAAAQTAANIQAGTTLMTGLGKVASSAGDLFDKGSTPATKPTPLNPAVMPSTSSIDKAIGTNY